MASTHSKNPALTGTLMAVIGALLLAWPLAHAAAESPEQKGLAIAKKVDAANDGWKGETSTMEMVLVNAHGDKTTRKLRSQAIEVSGEGDRSRIEFEWPADVKGTRMLTWTHKQGDDDQWLFLPAINRVKRISAGNKSGSFMGSEFAYEDLASQEVDKFKHKYVADEVLGGRKTWKIERVPTDARSGYSKQNLWIDQEYQQPLKIEYFDRKGELLKTATFSDFEKLGKHFRAKKLVMVNHQTKKESHLSFQGRKLGESLKEKEFESDSLGE
jgi:outer membrane lipoprotein-sorting protein